MTHLEKLTTQIIADSKMTAQEVLSHIAESYSNGKTPEEEFSCLYEEAYGRTITKSLAEHWVKSMAITDGSNETEGSVRTNGQKWTMEEAYEVGTKVGIDWHKVDKISWYIVMNMMYSDYFATAKSVQQEASSVYFARMAKDWLCDEDAPADKLYRYYFYVIL